jgi:hypothetical protein
MRSTQLALRFCLIAVAGALAAAAAHVVIDIAGDYLLARDSYDGMEHHSRALLLALVGVAILLAAIRTIFEILDRRCGSATSVLTAVRSSLGHPGRFAAESAGVAVLALVAMETFDCALSGRKAGLTDLFGGSLLLGGSTIVVAGAISGWFVHRLVAFIAKHESPITAFVLAVFRLLDLTVAAVPLTKNRSRALRSVGRALLLSRQGRKRGPPAPIPG